MIKIKIDGLNLSCGTDVIPAQGSANIPVVIELENQEDYSGYALVPYVGWFENGILISTVRELLNNAFTIPANAFKRGGKIKIAFAYIKDTTKIKTFPINFNVANAPEAGIKLPDDGTWETLVSNLVTNLFESRFENEINEILENARKLNSATADLQERINTAISYMGNYEWNGTQIRFQLSDGTWGPYHDLSGDFASKTYVDNHIFGPDNLEDTLNLKNKDITLPTEIKTGDTSIDLSKLIFYEE